MKLSFIIPFYNGKKYIQECLDSLYEQDLKENEYEVLVVDDCSTDKESLEVVRAYSEKHTNMRMLKNEQNMRVGASRNHGIREAKGKYIWFVDQDDKIASNSAKTLLERMEKEQLDCLTFDFLDFDDAGNYKPHKLITHDTEVMTGLEYAYQICDKQIWEHEWDTNVWHQLYKREFLLAHEIYFTEVSFYDDMIVNLKTLMYAKRLRAIPQAFYHYRYNEQSVLHAEVGVGGRTLFDATINAAVVLLNLSKETKEIDAFFSKHFYDGALFRINSFTKNLLRISVKEQKEFFKQVIEHPDVVMEAWPYLKRLNRMIISHPKIVFGLQPVYNWLRGRRR
jgi:glycosyltransferase involved in cell wall biosynthesis